MLLLAQAVCANAAKSAESDPASIRRILLFGVEPGLIGYKDEKLLQLYGTNQPAI